LGAQTFLAGDRRRVSHILDKVHDAVEYLVTWAWSIAFWERFAPLAWMRFRRKGHKYLTLAYQIDLGCTRLLWIGKNGQ